VYSAAAGTDRYTANGVTKYFGVEGGYVVADTSVAFTTASEGYTYSVLNQARCNVMLQKTYVPDMLTAKQVKNNGQADMYYIENTHEVIIETTSTSNKKLIRTTQSEQITWNFPN